jgi:hypothetical protein
MKRKRKRITPERLRELLGEEFYERHQRTQRLLAERIAHHRVKLAEERGERLDEQQLVRQILEADPDEFHRQTQDLLAERIAYHRARLADERG